VAAGVAAVRISSTTLSNHNQPSHRHGTTWQGQRAGRNFVSTTVRTPTNTSPRLVSSDDSFSYSQQPIPGPSTSSSNIDTSDPLIYTNDLDIQAMEKFLNSPYGFVDGPIG